MSRSLPLRADLAWLKKHSKERLEELRASDPQAKLSHAQLAVAREYGFSSWRKLKEQVEKVRAQLDALVPAEARRRGATETIAADDPDLPSFFAAIERGEMQLVAEKLAARPALVRARGPEGQTPLHVAAEYDDARLAALLIAYGADLAARYGDSGHTALSWAVTCRAMEAARAISKLGGEADLFCAAGIGSLDEVRECFTSAGALRPGAVRTGSSRIAPGGARLPCPPETACERISDALYIASRNGCAGVVGFLLGKDPDLAFRAYLGATPLHWAHFSGSREVVKLLIEAGADEALRDESLGCQPRSFGACVTANWGFAPLLEKLLDDDPSLANYMDGFTSPLHEAARNDRAECVRLLLARGANPALVNGEGKTPAELAAECGHQAIAETLRAASAD